MRLLTSTVWLFLIISNELMADQKISPSLSTQKVLSATTEEYPGERSEIHLNLNDEQKIKGLVLIKFEKDKIVEKIFFSLNELNSKEGVILKEEFTVALLVLKGINFNENGGRVDFQSRKSNWDDEYESLHLMVKKNNESVWIAIYDHAGKEKVIESLKIVVWKGLGFGIDKVVPHFKG